MPDDRRVGSARACGAAGSRPEGRPAGSARAPASPAARDAPAFDRCGDADKVELFLGSFDGPVPRASAYETWAARRDAWLPELPIVCRRCPADRAGTGRAEP